MTEVNVTNNIADLNDSDILRLEKVFRILESRAGTSRPLEAFRKEIIERFGEAGFKVDVKVWSTNLTGVYQFDIEIQERLEGKFDPDQMVYEATHDVLGLGESGFIKSGVSGKSASGLWTPPSHKH